MPAGYSCCTELKYTCHIKTFCGRCGAPDHMEPSTQRTIDFTSPVLKQPPIENDENCYGFGSFSDTFNGPIEKSIAFDYGLVQEYYVDKKTIVHRFNDATTRYPHIAMRCNGVLYPGGLGEILFSANNCVWLQNPTVVIQLPLIEMKVIESIRFQNRMDAIHVILQNQTNFEFVFMPGPFQKPTHMEMVLHSMRRKRKDPLRDLVVAYLNAAKDSNDSFELACTIQKDYGYWIGPSSLDQPLFSSSLAFRKKIVKELNTMISNMKTSKEIEVKEREKHTGLRLDTGNDGNNIYIDIATNETVTPEYYEMKYKAYVQDKETIVVPSLIPPVEEETPPLIMEEKQPLVEEKHAPLEESTKEEETVESKSSVDITSEAIAAEVKPQEPTDDRDVEIPDDLEPVKEEAEILRSAFVNEIDRLESELWATWDSAMAKYHQEVQKIKSQLQSDFEKLRESSTPQKRSESTCIESDTDVPEKEEKEVKRRKNNSRRLSILNPMTVDVEKFEEEICAQPEKEEEKTATPTEEELTAIRRRQRRARRKSIIAPTNLSEFGDDIMAAAEETTATSDVVGEETPSSQYQCPVCHDRSVSVILQPCEHKICQNCFLKWFENGDTCPYDRQPVLSFSQL